MGVRVIKYLNSSGTLVSLDAPDAIDTTQPYSSLSLGTTPATFLVARRDPVTGKVSYAVWGEDEVSGVVRAYIPPQFASTSRSYTLAIKSGNSQSGAVAAALGSPNVVKLTDDRGAAVVGRAVQFDTSNGSLSVVSAVTDINGEASVTWTLDTLAGAQAMSATVSGVGTVAFAATGTPATADVLLAISPLLQSGQTSTAVTTKPTVQVVDIYGNPKSGKTITFAVATGGGSGTTLTPATASDGTAQVGSWTLGAGTGAQTMTATLAGATNSPFTFQADAASPNLPQRLTMNSGGAQTGVTAGGNAANIVLKVDTLGGTAVQGITVAARVVSGGGTIAATAVTNASGLATFATPATGTTMGRNVYEFTAVDGQGASLSGSPVQATVDTIAGAAAKLLVAAQPPSNVANGISFSCAAQLADTNNNPVTTAGVSCTIAKQSGPDTLSGGTLTRQTNSLGIALWNDLVLTDAGTTGTNVLRASSSGLGTLDFAPIAADPPFPAKLAITQTFGGATAGAPLAGQLDVQVQASDGTLVVASQATITIALTTPGGAALGGITQKDAAGGLASFLSNTISQPGTYTVTASSPGLSSAISASITVAAASGFNEPAGMTPLLGATGRSLVSGATGITFSAVTFRDGRTYTAPAITPGSPVNAPGVPPSGDPNLMEINFLKDHPAGQGSGQCYGNPNIASLNARGLYYRAYVKLSTNWYGNSTGVCKLFQPLIASTAFSGVNNRTIVSPHGAAAADPLQVKVGFQGIPGGSTTFQASNNGQGGASKFHRDEWHLWEVYQLTNTAGNADGALKIWLDGVLIMDLTGLIFDPATCKHLNWQLQSVWGGQTGTVPNIQYIWIGGPLYASYHT